MEGTREWHEISLRWRAYGKLDEARNESISPRDEKLTQRGIPRRAGGSGNLCPYIWRGGLIL